MHNLKTNFDKILPIVNTTLFDQFDTQGNLPSYLRLPALADADILALLQEALVIDSERWFWSKLQADYGQAFPSFPHLTDYNRCRKRLAGWIERLTKRWAHHLCPDEDTFIVGSIPVLVAHIACKHSTRVCPERFKSTPNKGYSAITGQYCRGYNLHFVGSLDRLYQAMDLTKVSIHDVHYLNDIKHSGLRNCLLLADKGYLSQGQMELFASKGIDLQTLMRRNQHDYSPRLTIFKTARRRIETSFSQLCDQMMLKRNYAKTFVRLRARLIAKVTAVMLLQHINEQNESTP